MPTKNQSTHQISEDPEHMMTVQDIAALLIKHYDIHEGLFDLAIQFQIGAGAVGPNKDSLLPGAIIGFSGVGLKKVKKTGSNTLDAAKINPAKRARRSKPASKKITP